MKSYGIIKSIRCGSSSPNGNEFGNYYAIEVVEENGSLRVYHRIPGIWTDGDPEFLDREELKRLNGSDNISHMGYELMGPSTPPDYTGLSYQKGLILYHSQKFYIRKNNTENSDEV